MKLKLEFFGKVFFPIAFILTGLLVIYYGITTSQNGWFMLGGILVSFMGILSLMMFFDNIAKNNYFKIVAIVLIPVVFVSGYLAYSSIDETVKFDETTVNRDSKVIERLKDIRTAQFYYKAQNDTFASTFESLIEFVNNGNLKVVKAIGTVNDSLLNNRTLKQAEEYAIKMGFIKRDTFLIRVKDTLVKQITSPIDSFPFIPFSGGQKFELQAGKIVQGRVNVPVFEINADRKLVYKGLDDVMIRNKCKSEDKYTIKMGDMTKPVTTGNWE